jgi:hypothetical protein
MCRVRIGDADKLDTGNFSEDAGMIATHYADAHNPYAQNPTRAPFRGSRHRQI